jgi:hypothetical protein
MKYMNQMLNRVFIPQQRKLRGSSVVQAPGQVQRRSGESSEGSEEGLGGFGAEPGQVQQGSREGSGERSGEGSGRLWCRAKSGSTGFLTHGNPAEVFPALGFAARFRKICKHKSLRLLGIRPKLIYFHRNTPQVLLYQYVPEWN